MSLVCRTPILVFVAVVACAQHAKQLAKSATMGVKTQISQFDPVVARTIGDQSARGAVTGALEELTTQPNRELIAAAVEATSAAAAHGIARGLAPDSGDVQQLVDRTVAAAAGSLSRRLASDGELRYELVTIARQMSASAVYGARDAVPDIFPECSRVSQRRRCIEDHIADVSRAAARGLALGVLDAARLPILVLVFLAGVVLALLLVRARPARSRAGPSG